MPEGRLQRTRDNYPEGVPQFGGADPYGWFRESLRKQDQADFTVTLTRDELVAQLEEIAGKNFGTAATMARILRMGYGSDLAESMEFRHLANLLPADDPLSVEPR